VTSSDLSNLVKAINDQTSKTGITAEISQGKDSITLIAANGEDIKIGNFNSASAVDVGSMDAPVTVSMDVTGAKGAATTLYKGGDWTGDLQADSVTVGGTITFLSTASSFNIKSSISAESGGLFSGDAEELQSSDLLNVSTVDISTVEGAQDAIDIIDGALAMVNSIRADLGAVQNRFQTTIANLQTTSENISAARSRIQDADFAAETAALTRSQILQQAGVAMLAQANALPNQVLRLLQQ
jgi:flagellin